jgi:hypothetical protein
MGPLRSDPNLKTVSKCISSNQQHLKRSYVIKIQCCARTIVHAVSNSTATRSAFKPFVSWAQKHGVFEDSPCGFIPPIHDKIITGETVNQLSIWYGIRRRIIMLTRNRQETVTYTVEPIWSPHHISVRSILILSSISAKVLCCL